MTNAFLASGTPLHQRTQPKASPARKQCCGKSVSPRRFGSLFPFRKIAHSSRVQVGRHVEDDTQSRLRRPPGPRNSSDPVGRTRIGTSRTNELAPETLQHEDNKCRLRWADTWHATNTTGARGCEGENEESQRPERVPECSTDFISTQCTTAPCRAARRVGEHRSSVRQADKDCLDVQKTQHPKPWAALYVAAHTLPR